MLASVVSCLAVQYRDLQSDTVISSLDYLTYLTYLPAGLPPSEDRVIILSIIIVVVVVVVDFVDLSEWSGLVASFVTGLVNSISTDTTTRPHQFSLRSSVARGLVY